MRMRPPGAAPGTRSWRRWPEWVPFAAALWSLTYGALGIFWYLGGAGFPFGAGHDPAAHLTVLERVQVRSAAPAIAALGVITAAAAIVMARAWGRGLARAALLTCAWTTAVWLALGIPDFRVLVIVAYTPILLIGAPFGWPEDVRLFEAVPWPVVNQLVCMGGGLLWAATATAYQRHSRGACGHCGRGDRIVGWSTPDAVRRWGGWAVAIAVFVPLVYAFTRWAWALGMPLGLSPKFYREGLATGLWWRGAALATLAISGALLTLGLVQPWGEIFPRWLPWLAGKRVPRALVIIPAAFTSIIVTTAGLMFVRFALRGDFALGNNAVNFEENFVALAPELLWPLWGAALGAAAYAYYYRTRARCAYCGRL
jgi:hypothetical protein